MKADFCTVDILPHSCSLRSQDFKATKFLSFFVESADNLPETWSILLRQLKNLFYNNTVYEDAISVFIILKSHNCRSNEYLLGDKDFSSGCNIREIAAGDQPPYAILGQSRKRSHRFFYGEHFGDLSDSIHITHSFFLNFIYPFMLRFLPCNDNTRGML